MNKLTYEEFSSLIKLLLVDRYFPDNCFIPGLGVYMSITPQSELSKTNEVKGIEGFILDLYRAYVESGEAGIIAFITKLKGNPSINKAFEMTKDIYSTQEVQQFVWKREKEIGDAAKSPDDYVKMRKS